VRPQRGHVGCASPGVPQVKRYTSSVAVAALVLAGSVAATAQDASQAQSVPAAAAPASGQPEEIVVTGSRIKRTDLVASSPVSIVDNEELQLTATVNVEDVIRALPQAVPGISPGINNGNPGVATVNLRGLDDERTLVLVDGKRFVGYDSEGIVDLNNIPTSLIERIDVVTGGASAVYGSDAIAGVVNFILKDDFEGVQVDYDYDNVLRGTGTTTDNFGITMGGNFDGERGNAAVYIGWTKRDALSQNDRPFSRSAIDTDSGGAFGSSTDTMGAIDIPAGARLGFMSCTPAGRCDLLPRGARRFNFNKFNYLQVPEVRYQATALVHYDLNDWATVYGRATFAQTEVDTKLAPSGSFGSEFAIPYDSHFLTTAARDLLYPVGGLGVDQEDAFGNKVCFNDQTKNGTPFDVLDTNCDGNLGVGDAAKYPFYRRTIEAGTRDTRNRTQAYQIVGGIRGDIPMLDGWSYDFSVQHGRTELSRVFDDVKKTRFQDLLDASSESLNPSIITGGTSCLSSAPSNCVVGNLFGDGNLSQAATDYIKLQINEQVFTTQDVIMLSASGDLGEAVHIPGADPIGIAIGGEWRRTKSESFPDDCYSTPDCSLGFGSTTAVRASQTVKELFGEILIPLVQEKPFVDRLELESGFRWADYSTVGSVTAYKVGGTYAPIKDFRLRVLYQRAVRAPNIFETSQPLTPDLDNSVGDPCAGFAEANGGALPLDTFTKDLCVATGAPAGLFTETAPGSGVWITRVQDVIAGQVNILESGNVNLKQEKSKTITAGGVYQPSWLEGLNITVDWYRVSIDDAVSNFAADDIFGGCYNQVANPTGDPNQQLCAFVSRNPLTGALIGNPNYGLLEPESNISTLEVSGIDFDVDYATDLGNFGRVDITFQANKLLKHDDKPSSLTPTNRCKGLYGPVCNSPNVPLGFQQRTTWYINDFYLGYRWRYIGATKFEAGPTKSSTTGRIPAFHYVDITLGWEPTGNDFLNGFRFQVLLENIFDQDPPIVGQSAGPTDQNSGNTFPGTYDVVGRTLSLSVSKKF
jgi:outer membrane receptor protein involved in Fe transport